MVLLGMPPYALNIASMFCLSWIAFHAQAIGKLMKAIALLLLRALATYPSFRPDFRS